MEIKLIVACPRDCYDTCFFEAKKLNGDFALVPLDIPYGKIVGCPRASAESRRTRSNERVLYPYIRKSKSSDFKRVDWDTALSLVAEKLEEVLSEFGPEKILYFSYAGNMGLITRYYSERLWRYLGATMSDGSICDGGGDRAISLHYGSSYGQDIDVFGSVDLIVYWGFNASLTSPHNYQLALDEKRRRNIKIFTVDVIRTQTAKSSDLFLQVRPGSDIYLALGIANYIIENEMYDKDFIEEHTYGFDKFREYVSKYNLELVSEKTGIDKNIIVSFANDYALTKRSVIFIGYGLQRRMGGGEAVRAISLLPALMGIHRGFYYSNPEGLKVDFDYIKGKHLGAPRRIIPQPKLGEFLVNGEFKFVYIHLTNPVFTHPNAQAIEKGLKRDDVFVVVHETHWSETARLANVVLPAPTWPEKNDFMRSYWHTYLAYTKRIIDPLGESREEFWVMHELAKRIRLNNDDIFEDPIIAVRKALGDNVFNEVIHKGYVKLPYENLDVYETPSGKIEFYSLKAEKNGINPLPRPVISDDDEYPFVLVTTTTVRYTNSQFRDVYGKPQPYIFIHPTDAEKLGLNEGDTVQIESPLGSLELLVKIDDDTQPGLVYTFKQVVSLDGKPINHITSDEVSEHGGGTMNSTRVKIVKKDISSSSIV